MRRLVAGVALGAILCAGAVWAAEAPQDTVAARVDTMKRMGGDVKVATDFTSKPADAKAKLADAIKIAESIPSFFPKGTGIGDPGVTKSRALQDIWAKPTEFKAAADNLANLLKAADKAIDSGDNDKMGAAFNAIGKGCKNCHDTFRGPQTE